LKHLISIALCVALLSAAACAKKEPKPLRTEPWLAHPQASSAAESNAATPTVRYLVSEPSVIHFESSSRHGIVRGTVRRLSGELDLDLGDLSRSRGQVRADLTSLTIQDAEGRDQTALLARAQSALELSDAGPGSTQSSFELTALEGLSPTGLEPAPESDAGTTLAFTRRARATAVGDLLLHGFRVVRRAPIEAEFGFSSDRRVPSSVVIRSRAPFVVSLEMHAIRTLAGEGRAMPGPEAATHAREVHVSVELYGKRLN
jgi:hypothetical protein